MRARSRVRLKVRARVGVSESEGEGEDWSEGGGLMRLGIRVVMSLDPKIPCLYGLGPR